MTSEQRGRLESLAASCGPSSTVGGDVAAALAEVDRLRALADRTPADCDEVLRLRAEVERLTAELAEERRPKSLWAQEEARKQREAAGQ